MNSDQTSFLKPHIVTWAPSRAHTRLRGTFVSKTLLVFALGAIASVPCMAKPQAPSEPAPPPIDTTQQPQTSPDGQAPQTSPGQQPQQPVALPGQTQTGQTPPTTQAPGSQSPTAQKQTSQPQTPAAKASDAPIPQKDNPDVKQGSEADVDAIGNRSVGKGVNFYSLEKEIAMGKAYAQEVERSAKLVDDPVVTEYVNRVGQNLVRNSDAKVPFTIKVIDSDQVNAFALPGGFFYVNSGLILRADSEAELAGVMAHEIAHVAARHGTRNETKGEIAQMATIPLILLGPGGWAGYGLYEGLNFAIPMSFLKFSRDNEREADYLGLQYMYKAGYDPNAFVTFFEKVEAEEKRQPGTIPKFFSTHPPTPERVVNIQKEISDILPARDQYIVTTSEFDTVKARLHGIENRTKLQDQKTTKDKPTLRTRTEQPDANGGSQGQTTTSSSPSDDPDRPTLHKRDDDGSPSNP
jgi:beta-barrel assembly-enhancing protease